MGVGFFFICIDLIEFADLLKDDLGSKSANRVYLVEKLSSKETFVLKMILMGKEGTKEREKTQKEIESEVRVGMTVSQECIFLVQYTEVLYHNNCCCLIQEYC
jgi:hypothetical protein